MIYRVIIQSSLFFLLIACTTNYQTTELPTEIYLANISKSAIDEWSSAMQSCNNSYKQRILKTNYARGLCMDKAISEYLAEYYINQYALKDARSQMLLVMIQLDKKQVTPEEAGLLNERIINKSIEIELATEREVARNNLAAQQAHAQQENALGLAVIGGLQQSLDTQRQWVQQQQQAAQHSPPGYTPSIYTNCNANGNSMNCMSMR